MKLIILASYLGVNRSKYCSSIDYITIFEIGQRSSNKELKRWKATVYK